MILKPSTLQRLEQHLMLFFTGFPRTASDLAKAQIAQIAANHGSLRRMLELVDEATAILRSEEDRLDDFGKLLHQQWLIKQGISSKISNNPIDAIYQAVMKAGAL